MKYQFFDNQNVAFNNQGANGPAVINFGGGGVINLGGANDPINFNGNGGANAAAFVDGNNVNFHGGGGNKLNMVNVIFGGVQIIGQIGFVLPMPDPVVEGAIATINNPETTILDLSGINLNDVQLQIICRHLPNNQNIEFIDLSDNQITQFGLQQFITTNYSLASADFSGCPINTNHNLLVIEQNIYQSSLINCTFDGINLLSPREENANTIMSVLYKILSSFDLDSAQEREALIKFIKSPKAQKALKWLSQNSEVASEIVGEQFVFLLNRMAQENIFYLKAVCKELNVGSFFFNLPNEGFFQMLSYLDLQDIILATTGPVIEEVDLSGNSSSTNPFQSTDGDDDLYS